MKKCCRKTAKKILDKIDKLQATVIDKKADKEGDVYILSSDEFEELKREYLKTTQKRSIPEK